MRGKKPTASPAPAQVEAPVAQTVGKAVPLEVLIEWSKKSFAGRKGDQWAAWRDARTDYGNVVGALTRLAKADHEGKPQPLAAAAMIETVMAKRGWSSVTLDGTTVYTRKVN